MQNEFLGITQPARLSPDATIRTLSNSESLSLARYVTERASSDLFAYSVKMLKLGLYSEIQFIVHVDSVANLAAA